MTSPTIDHLRVDGATLHYEVRGRGPAPAADPRRHGRCGFL
ncbi:hypothetical protein [Microtetraspora sp. AC03309]|nr:hypothetical protein [Microtetraspora sp. AC03309]